LAPRSGEWAFRAARAQNRRAAVFRTALVRRFLQGRAQGFRQGGMIKRRLKKIGNPGADLDSESQKMSQVRAVGRDALRAQKAARRSVRVQPDQPSPVLRFDDRAGLVGEADRSRGGPTRNASGSQLGQDRFD
jgi:hypothetical protein